MDPKLYFFLPDPTFWEISDPNLIPDPTEFLSKEAKAKFKKKTAAQILILKK